MGGVGREEWHLIGDTTVDSDRVEEIQMQIKILLQIQIQTQTYALEMASDWENHHRCK